MHGPRCRTSAPWPVHDQGGRDRLAIMRFGLELFLPKAYPIKCAKVPKKIHFTFTTSCLSSMGRVVPYQLCVMEMPFQVFRISWPRLTIGVGF